jgi:two-component system, cell cycle response regulator
MATHKKLMIVEDSMTQARAIAAYLSSEVDVVIAVDGTQALRLVRVELPDLIILDVNLPKLSGIQVCRRLKRDPETEHIPIIMLTAATSLEQMEEGLSAGADNYIRKGEHATEELLDIIRAYKLIDEYTTG